MVKINMLNQYSPAERQHIAAIQKDPRMYGLSEVEIGILYNRGIRTVEDIEHFLYDNVHHMEQSLLMKDCDKFCSLLEDGLRHHKNIACYTDYDVDGITSGLICLDGLSKVAKLLGSNSKIQIYANNRFVEGYGITVNGVKDLMDKYPDTDIIVTTDNGIVGYEGIDYAKSLGLTVIVTDHHTPGETLPNADAVVDVHRADDQYPFKHLCGAGVIFKLILQLAWNAGGDLDDFYTLLDLVAMGTVGDMMPLLGENRIFVREGLQLVRSENRLAFRILREGVEKYNKMQNKEKSVIVDEDLFGFLYCPMLNSLGRLDGSIEKAIELFTSDNTARMHQLVREIIEKNELRKDMTTEQTDAAVAKIEAMGAVPDVIVLEDDSYHEGIVGLIAGRLKELYNRPSFVFTYHDGVYKGSARSIDGVNLMDLLNKEKALLLGFGGHKSAAGLSIDPDKFDDFVVDINKNANLTDELRTKRVDVDMAFTVEDISEDLIDGIAKLKPYGMGFPKPRFGLSNFVADLINTGSPFRGADQKTVRLVDKNKFTVIMFKNPEAFQKVLPKFQQGKVIKVIGSPSTNLFNNVVSLQFQVEDNLMF